MSILSTNQKLISLGQDYSAGENIGINDRVISSRNWSPDITYAAESAFQRATGYTDTQISALSGEVSSEVSQLGSEIDYISGVALTAHQSLEGYLTKASGDEYYQPIGNYQPAGDYLSSNALEGYATQQWVDEQGYITGVDLSNYYTKDETSGKEELSNAFANIPVGDTEVNTYVHNNSATINGTTDLVQNSSGLWNDVAVYQSNSANYLTAHQDISNKLDESAFADVSGTFLTAHQSLDGYATVEDVESATSSKANISALDYYVPLSGITDGDGFARLDAYRLSISSESNNASSYGNYSTFGVGNYVKSANNVYQYAAEANLSQTGIFLYQSSAYGSANSGRTILNKNYLNLESVNGTAYIGLDDYYLLNIDSRRNNHQPSFIRFDRGNGLSYSAENSDIGQFFIQTSSNMDIPRYNPVWIVRNGSGDGFSIGAGEAKGFDKDGNTIWTTKQSKATQLINGGMDPHPAILLTPMPTTTAYTAQWTAAPYVSADYQSLTISYGPTATVPNIKIKPDDITIQTLTGNNSARAKFGLFAGGVQFETTAGTWSLTGSVQKREIECDSATSAITAIAGSAIGGGGGVPQSAFDELKQSYDALSSLFATYSGQWLLPNEGEE